MNDIENQATKERFWDFKIKDGFLSVIDGNEAQQQKAIVATFLQRGTVPQIPSLGIQWAELFTGSVMPQQVNAQIMSAITEFTGGLKFCPKYSYKNGKLIVEVRKV